MKISIQLITVVAFTMSLLTAGYAATNQAKPNVIVVYIDDMGYADLGANGVDVGAQTPNMDRMAANGVRCTKGYVSAPMCGPSRAGLITGRYQQRFGYELHMNPSRASTEVSFGVPLSEKTIADYMKGQGYKTFAFGKWHLGYEPDHLPHKRGFDEYYGYITPGNQNFLKEIHLEKGIIFWDGEILHPQNPLHLSEEYTSKALDFIDRQKDDPFFMYLAYTAVHAPCNSTGDYEDKYRQHFEQHPFKIPDFENASSGKTTVEKRIALLAQLEQLDHNIGRLLDKLEQPDLDEDTLVFLISDNGGKPHTNGSWNFPFKGRKSQLFEGGIHVPYLVQWKGRIPSGTVYDKPVLQLDVLPTALAAASSNDLPSNLDGVNLMPFFTGETAEAPHDQLFWCTGDNWAVLADGWKLVHTASSFSQTPKGNPQLYDLNEDPNELNDLYAAAPEKVEQLKALHAEWDQHNVTPLFGGKLTDGRVSWEGAPQSEDFAGLYDPLTGKKSN